MGSRNKQPGRGRVTAGTIIMFFGAVAMVATVVSFLGVRMVDPYAPAWGHLIAFGAGAVIFIAGVAVRHKSSF